MVFEKTADGVLGNLTVSLDRVAAMWGLGSAGSPEPGHPAEFFSEAQLSRAHSFNGIAQRSSVFSNPEVAGDDHQGWRVAQGFRGRQMNGVQCADRFHWKRASGAGEDRFRDAHNVATPGKSLEREQRCAMLLGRYPPREARSKNGAVRFGNRRADVTRPWARIEALPAASPSSIAATNALDSI